MSGSVLNTNVPAPLMSPSKLKSKNRPNQQVPTTAVEEKTLGCEGAADALREDVVRSAWYEAFRADMRSNVIVRAVESSITGVGSATVWTTSRLATASQRFLYARPLLCFPATEFSCTASVLVILADQSQLMPW